MVHDVARVMVAVLLGHTERCAIHLTLFGSGCTCSCKQKKMHLPPFDHQ